MFGSMFGSTHAAGCGAAAPAEPASTSSAGGESAASAAKEPAPGHGGRLFDNWVAELESDFVPDDPSTEALDGQGGPFGNGTLPDAEGKPMPNPGHDYRLKNLFGWDLRGADGIDGQAKKHVLVPSLLSNTDSREVWIERLSKGEDAIPAYAGVLSPEQIAAVVDFMLGVREGALPRPEDVFTLSPEGPGGYALVDSGSAANGHTIYAQTCANCHGADGAKFPIDGGAHSVGSFARTHAYEAWLKVLNGHPGSGMHAQLEMTLTREQKAGALRDLMAALCDRTRYPLGKASGPDIDSGDPRCGSYAK
jgi:mono/diheme cytochrome c family protein